MSIHEECGVFGVFSGKMADVANISYYGLYALQHRGQESCGIVVNDDGLFAANVKHFFTPLGKEFFLYTVSTFLHCSVTRFLHRKVRSFLHCLVRSFLLLCQVADEAGRYFVN